MPLTALALVLFAALLHAVWNLAAKRTGGDHRFAFITACMVLLLWAPVAAWFGWRELPGWGWAEWAIVAASAAVHALYFDTLMRGYRAADLTVVYPVARGSAPLVTAGAAVLLLGESLGPLGLAGVLAVCGGVFLVAGGPRIWQRMGQRMGQATHDTQRVKRGVFWGGLTGLAIAGYTVIDGYAVKIMLIGPVLLDYFGNLLRLPLLAPGVWRDRKGFGAVVRAQWKPALVVATLGPLAYVCVLYAVTMAPLSHVAPAREVSMLFAALLGGRLLGEGDRGWRMAGACCIAGGVVMLAGG